jgi:hypothetical protein
MGKGLDIEDSDAFFNMRRRFWEQARDRPMAEKERDIPFSQQSQKGTKRDQHPHRDPARIVSGS